MSPSEIKEAIHTIKPEQFTEERQEEVTNLLRSIDIHLAMIDSYMMQRALSTA